MIENYYIKTNDSARMSIEIKGYQNNVLLEEVTPEQSILDELDKELDDWKIIKVHTWSHEDLAYEHKESGEDKEDFDLNSFNGASETFASIKIAGVLIDDNKFSGVVLVAESTSSFGMAVNKSTEYGILYADGSIVGKTYYSFSHCSTEVDKSSKTALFLSRK